MTDEEFYRKMKRDRQLVWCAVIVFATITAVAFIGWFLAFLFLIAGLL